MPREPSRPDYGLDAPGVVRNLTLASAIGLLLFGWSRWKPGADVRSLHLGPLAIVFPWGSIGLWVAIGCGGMALWMLWYSRAGKLRERERLLNLLPWTGRERVLDVGCGRGLMLIGAARRLTTGSAVGIDLWQASDLSGNRPEATLENARLEGVAQRVEVKTGDMRQLPFPDRSFDVVLSCAAVHNLPTAADREQAIREIARVLTDGGQVVISDIRNLGDYAASLVAAGCAVTARPGSRAMAAVLMMVTFGSLIPGVVVARKG